MRLAELLESTSPAARARAEMTGTWPVAGPLAPLLPDGGLPCGVVTQAAGDLALALALTGGASTARPAAWSAAVGLPELGLAAWAGHGQDLARALLVDHPGEQHWAEVVSVLIPAVDVLLVAPPPGALTPHLVQRLGARLRRHRCALVSTGPWPGAALHLEVAGHEGWEGLADGHGQLTRRRVTVRSTGRLVWRAREAELLLPGASGAAETVVDAETSAVPPVVPLAAGWDAAAEAY
ncbi:hypothetical protein ACIQF6_28145 [Kitasatospora sp. NPDC092948]|uniref:hypothetical protein n=1 Tax=Kitasatospora sp. NPDC092948 TaxID=3364088 RepID=UPI0037FFF4FE